MRLLHSICIYLWVGMRVCRKPELTRQDKLFSFLVCVPNGLISGNVTNESVTVEMQCKSDGLLRGCELLIPTQ